MKNAVITGVSRGIGRATAEAFLEQGWQVIGSTTTGSAEWRHDNLTVLPLRLQDEASIAQFAGAVQTKTPLIDLLVNNAGVNPGPDDKPLSVKKLRETLEIDLIGVVDLTGRLLDNLADGGMILTISSTAGLPKPPPVNITPYRTAKFGLTAYTQALANQMADKDVAIVALNPGWVDTDMGSSQATKKPSDVATDILNLVADPPESGTFWDETTLVEWK